MITVLKLLYGPKNNPTATLDLNQSGRKIYMRSEGFAPAAGQKNVIWGEVNPRSDGQRRHASSRGNAQFSLTYGLDSGSSVGEVQYWQSQIHNFVEHVRQFEERRVGGEIWLQYLPETNLSGITEPAWGLSLHRYIRVRDIEVPSYPRSLHGGILQLNYAINDILCNLTCDPYAESLEFEALACTTIPTGSDDADLQITLSGSEFATTYTVETWVRHRNSSYVIWEYYVDASNYLRLEWDQTDGRYELVQRRSGVTNTRNFNTQTLTNGAWVHVSVYYDGTTTYGRVNGAQQLSVTATATYSSGGVFYAGEATSVATTPNNNLDALRIFSTALSSTQSDYIYANESPVKSAGNNIALVTYCKTRATRQIDAVDGVVSAAAKDNYAVIGNVPGDTEALTRIKFDPPSGSSTTNPSTLIRGFWLSRNAQDATFTPYQNTFIDFSGTAASGSASGDAYSASGTAANGDVYSGYGSAQRIRGDVNFVGRLSSGGTNPIEVRPTLRFGRSLPVVAEPGITMLPNDTMRLRKLGSMRVDWPQASGPGVYTGVRWKAVTSSTLHTDLVSWWNFEESLGEPVEDWVGKNHLTRYQEVAYNTGKIGRSQSMLTANSGYYWCQGDDLNFDGDFHFALWVLLISTIPAQNQQILGKWSGANSSQYLLDYNYSVSKFTFSVYNDAGSSTTLSATLPSPASTGSYYMIDCWHTDGSQIGIRINNGTKYTTSWTGGVKVRDQIFSMGKNGNLNLDMTGAWKRNLTDAEVTSLYNSGNGLDYPFATSALNLDFINVLTEPTLYTEGDWPALGSGDTVVINGMEGWVEDASDSDYQQVRLDCRGNPITVLPGKYNYLTMLLGAENDPYTVGNAVTEFRVLVTPRWHLL